MHAGFLLSEIDVSLDLDHHAPTILDRRLLDVGAGVNDLVD